ncbi:hypothetical protein IWW50_003347 [Coemansia erecta]|nr:hypothetical protein IWW50_003347 [Coemansia erecta]
MATLNLASAKLANSGKQQTYSRPASTSSGTSVASAVDTPDSLAAATKTKLTESLDSFSTMPTPRNTFLTPPTGISLSDKGVYLAGATGAPAPHQAPAWDSEQHQEQLHKLIEQRGVPRDGSASTDAEGSTDTSRGSDQNQHQKRQAAHLASYDDTYFMLNQPAAAGDGPHSRSAAVAMLRRLAGVDARGRQLPAIVSMPLPLAPAVDALGELEDALLGIVARRQIPNRARVSLAAKGGAGSFPAAAGATIAGSAASPCTDKPARRKQRLSTMSGEHDGGSGGADDRRSMRSRTSVISGEIAAGLSAGVTPYIDLNGHIERLTACISRLQPAPAEGSSLRSASKAPSMASLQHAPAHGRQGSVSSGGFGARSAAAASTQCLVTAPQPSDAHPPLPPYDENVARQYLNARLSPVTESPATAASGRPIRSRSSSHLSAVSGTSTESRRRIVVGEVPTSAQYPNLFGASLSEMPAPGRMQSQPYQSPTMPTQSSGSGSIYSQDSSDGRSQTVPAIMPGYESPRAMSIVSKPRSKGSGSPSLTSPAVSVRDITPAGRLALWMQLHTTTEAQKPTLWRRKQWHRRFMVFAGNMLYLFKSSAPAATALSIIRLAPNTIVCVNDSFHNRSWVVEITQAAPAAGDAQPSLAPGIAPFVPQSWYLQMQVRSEMIVLLKQLKVVIGELQVQPDIERKEEERMRNRRRKHRRDGQAKTDVCPWEVEEFSDGGSAGSDAGASCAAQGAGGLFRIADDELFSSDDDSERCALGSAGARPGRGAAEGARGARPARLQIADYTGTGGIAEWGAHRLQVPYSPSAAAAGMHPTKVRSFSGDPSAATGRRPSLADVLAPPASAMQETTPIASYSPQTPPQTIRAQNAAPAVRNSMMLRADASVLIDQMFASASRDMTPASVLVDPMPAPEGRGSDGHTGPQPPPSSSRSNLFVVREED